MPMERFFPHCKGFPHCNRITMLFFSLTVVVLANVLYHTAQKSIAPSVHPLIATIVAYIAAIVLCLPMFALFPLQTSIGEELKRINWATYALALSIVGVELGYLLAYRAGWDVSIASVIANVGIAILLVPVGIWLFKESVSWTTLLGITLCLAGVALIAKK